MLELCIVNNAKTDEIFNSPVFHKLDTICCLASQLGNIKDFKKVALLIDYPYGLNSTKIREHEILSGIRSGVQYLDVTINPTHIGENDFKSILTELRSFVAMTSGKNVQIRPMIHTMNFNMGLILDLCSCFNTCGISTIVTGNGLYNTDLSDELINACLIQEKTGLQSIICVQNCTEKTFELVNKSKIYGLRVMSQKSLERILNKT